MADSLVLSRIIQGELPFSLNLPEGLYPIELNGALYQVNLLQNRIAVPLDSNSMQMGMPDQLQEEHQERWNSLYKIHLHTIVRHDSILEVTPENLIIPTETDLIQAAMGKLLEQDLNRAGDSKQLEAEAKLALADLDSNARSVFQSNTAIKLTARKLLPDKDVDIFCKSVNLLLRLYMSSFNDIFVQEITENVFSATAFHGLRVETFCNGQSLESVRHVGGLYPYMVKGPWTQFPEPQIATFKAQLATDPHPDPVKLLNVRARSLLKRGGYRSAIIEASAAFDLCLLRKIKSGYIAQGKDETYINNILKKNGRYDDRAKAVLKLAVGTSAADLDPQVWQRFVTHRAERGKVAHAAKEPEESDAIAAVDEIIRLTELIDVLPT